MKMGNGIIEAHREAEFKRGLPIKLQEIGNEGLQLGCKNEIIVSKWKGNGNAPNRAHKDERYEAHGEEKKVTTMMTVEEMRARKEELLYTYEMIAEKSGLPLSTVQKVLCGATKKPRRSTMEALDLVLKRPLWQYDDEIQDPYTDELREEALAYEPMSGEIKVKAVPIRREADPWYGVEPSDKWPRQG